MGNIITKLYLYDAKQEQNNYRGKDFSDYILQGDSETDDLTEILDVVNLTLVDLPFSQEFEPKTKFILEKWEDGRESFWKDWHLCVARDVVSQPILSDNTRFDHQITFNEASVDSQGRLVDNIAVTYRLKDVSLEAKPTYDKNAKAISEFVNVDDWKTTENFDEKGGIVHKLNIGKQFKWVFPDWYKVVIDGETKTPAEFGWNNFKLNQEIPNNASQRKITLPVPMLEILNGDKGAKTFSHQGYCSIDVIVEELDIVGKTKRLVKTMQVNPSSSISNENWNKEWGLASINIDNGYIYNRMDFYIGGARNYVKRIAKYDNEIKNRIIDIDIKPGCQYIVTARLHNFNVWDQSLGFNQDIDKTATYSYNGSKSTFSIENNPRYTDNKYPYAQLNFNAVLEGENVNLYLRNASAANAYDLYNKAFTTTQNIIKQQGVPIDETPKAYYLEKSDRQELENTLIVENFYNQKNWWELQLDIGKYIHAIPKVRFGSNDRFVTTWKKLGQTNQLADYGNKLSIYNSRNVEEYIAATSSYVSNMVQLGGIIDEWVPAKSSSSDYLVYNDVAEIILSRNIIELVDMDIKYIGENKSSMNLYKNEIRNLVGKGSHGESSNGYVFGKDVYNVLSINANTSVNKGLAIYYALGSNKIEGLNYRLPSVNPGEQNTEYAIKRIIGTIYQVPMYPINSDDPTVNEWKNIKINDFLFHVQYRTKDTLRVNQVRPDLQKYIITSNYDRVPQHHQFNNQTDTVVDSVKFGNNIYGMLIRTGNTTYTTTEWVDSLYKLKQAGELYNIRDNIYYVSKVKNTYYSNHIISEVEFSKDFNRLSQIIGIPSEPRFYEISEQSQIKRQVSFDDYIIVGTSLNETSNDSFIKNGGWGYIANLLLGNETTYPKYAVTVFKNDKEKATIQGNEDFYVEVCSFVGGYSIQNTLTLSWNMVDNFSAGDQKANTENSVNGKNDGVYATLLPFRYTDVYGRADLVDFALIRDYEIPNEKVMLMPANPINMTAKNGDNYAIAPSYIFGNEKLAEWGDNYHGIGLLKDNREALSFNYNLQVLADSHRFVLSAYMWQLNKTNLKIALLSEEVNKISNDTIPNNMLTENLFDVNFEVLDNGIKIKMNEILQNVDMQNIKSIAIISTNEVNDYNGSGAKYFIMARNITGLSEQEKIEDWYIGCIDKDKFYKNTDILENMS